MRATLDIYSVVPVLLTAFIGFLVYLYRNRIGYTVTTVSGDIPKDNDELTLKSQFGQLIAERLELTNYGFRDLENVELHFKMPSEPLTVLVLEPSSLSKKSIKTNWLDETLAISIPHLPPKEHIDIDLIRIGYYVGVSGRLKGTGGKYSIVRSEVHKSKQRLFDYFLIALCFIVPSAIGSWLETQVETPVPVIKQSSQSIPSR